MYQLILNFEVCFGFLQVFILFLNFTISLLYTTPMVIEQLFLQYYSEMFCNAPVLVPNFYLSVPYFNIGNPYNYF